MELENLRAIDGLPLDGMVGEWIRTRNTYISYIRAHVHHHSSSSM